MVRQEDIYNRIDSSMYAQMRNNLTSKDLIDLGISSTYIAKAPDASKLNSYLDDILSNTTVKRACCTQNNKGKTTSDKISVLVRIPIPSSEYSYGDNPSADIWQNHGYIDKYINVPVSVCNTYGLDYNTNSCQDFMTLYCNNIKKEFKSNLAQMKKSYTDADFAKFKPECSCYGDKPSYINGNPPPVCYLNACNLNDE